MNRKPEKAVCQVRNERQRQNYDDVYLHTSDNMTESLYYSYLDVNTLTLHGADGHQLADLNRGPLKLDNNETDPAHLVDRLPGIRNWNWDIAADKEGCPVILFVRINADKDRHHYCYAKWSGSDWQITLLADGGRWFHQNEERELCYSGACHWIITILPQCICQSPYRVNTVRSSKFINASSRMMARSATLIKSLKTRLKTTFDLSSSAMRRRANRMM